MLESDSISKEKKENLAGVWKRLWDPLEIDEDSIFNNKLDSWADSHKKLIDKYLERLRPNSYVFEAGCGLGSWAFYCYKKDFRVIGIDIVKDVIIRLNAYLSKNGIPASKIRFVEGDIRDIKHIDDSLCDLILCFGVLEHFQDNVAVLEEFHKILKTSGYIIITVPNLYSTLTITKPISRLLGLWTLGMQKHYSRKALRKIIPMDKFEIIEEGTLVSTELFGSFASYIPIIGHTLLNILRRLSKIIESRSNVFGFMRFIVLRKR